MTGRKLEKVRGLTVTERSAGCWRVQARRKGKLLWSGTFDTHQLAVAAGKDALSAKSPLAPACIRKVKLGYLLDAYIAEVKKKHEATATPELSRVSRLKRDAIAEIEAQDICFETFQPHIERWKNELGYQGHTIRLNLSSISQAINTKRLEKQWAWLPKSPTLGQFRIRTNNRERRLELRDGVSEEELLLRGAADIGDARLYAAIVVALDTAAREGEIANFERHRVENHGGVKMVFVPKGATARDRDRYVPLSRRAYEALNVLPTDTGRFFSGYRAAEDISDRFTSLVRRLGLHDLTFHDLRHEAISRLFERRPPLSDEAIMKITGHLSRQTLQRYVHLRGRDVLAEHFQDYAGGSAIVPLIEVKLTARAKAGWPPTPEILAALKLTQSNVQIARLYSVSEAAVRKLARARS